MKSRPPKASDVGFRACLNRIKEADFSTVLDECSIRCFNEESTQTEREDALLSFPKTDAGKTRLSFCGCGIWIQARIWGAVVPPPIKKHKRKKRGKSRLRIPIAYTEYRHVSIPVTWITPSKQPVIVLTFQIETAPKRDVLFKTKLIKSSILTQPP